MIRIADLSVAFGGVIALDAVTINMNDDVIGIIGPNGAGKTTLINVLSGFVSPKHGTVEIDGRNLLALAPFERARQGFARSFQKAETVDDLSVEDAVRVVLDPLRMSRAGKRAAIDAVLDFVGLRAAARVHGAELNPYQLRMTEIARCLVARPRVVLLDEPGGGMSESEVQTLSGIIDAIHGRYGAQVLLIDHDVELIRAVCSETVVLDFGKLIAFGPTATVLADDKVRAAYLGLAPGE